MNTKMTLRLTKAQLAAMKKAAKLEGRSLNNWAVRTLDFAAKDDIRYSAAPKPEKE